MADSPSDSLAVSQVNWFMASRMPKNPRARADEAVMAVEWRLTQLRAPARRAKARPVAMNGIPRPNE